jgi:murein DD-endopeptidase MepM/ murein hydrolase activator NlpD
MKHLRKFLLIGLILPTFLTDSHAQKNDSVFFQSPLNIPLYLSGSYGELRANHFHAGIDFKTSGEIGKPVTAAASGYVSRIKVQTEGYGKSIYITHPNGYTTVYAHLNQYIPSVSEYVKSNQYKKHSYEIDLFPPKNMFVVSKGDLIAYSGNTGSSGGPHLHFEVRKTKEEVPLNGLLFNLPVEDVRNPEFRTLHLYSLPEGRSIGNNGEFRTSYHVLKINSSLYEINRIIKCSTNYIGFSAEIYDFLNSSSNRCGIYQMVLKVDGNPVYSFNIDNISFDMTRYINAHMDYELKIIENTGVHRLFRLPNNMLPIYHNIFDDGIIHLTDDSLHRAEIIAMDAYGNKSVLQFRFQHINTTIVQNYHPDSLMLVKFDQESSFQLPDLKISIPAKALYRDIYLSLSSVKGLKGSLSDTFKIHMISEPLNSNISLNYMIDSVKAALTTKLLFVRVNGDNKLVSEGGKWSHGTLSANTMNFGKYFVTMDTIAPVIRSVNFTNGEKFESGQQIVFNVRDDLSGIKTYNLYINDRWALLEYDPKSDKMFYRVDEKMLTLGKIYSLTLFVMDEKNNITKFTGKFQY